MNIDAHQPTVTVIGPWCRRDVIDFVILLLTPYVPLLIIDK